jgi:hypothetical protein
LKKENLLCTHLTAHDREGKEVAEWKNPILSLHGSKVTIKFLGENGEKVVEVNPIGHDRVSEVCDFFFVLGVCGVSLKCLHFLDFSSFHSGTEALFCFIFRYSFGDISTLRIFHLSSCVQNS